MNEFWENIFKTKELIWGNEPSNSAIFTKDFFLKKGISNILIPGIGYGRNAKIFLDNKINVTGIEISQNAIEIAKKEISSDIKIYYGSVLNMPFDNVKYEGLFCYSLIHLFDKTDRNRIIKTCYEKLQISGYMMFTVISSEANIYGQGKRIGNNRFELAKDLNVFFYNEKSIKDEFKNYGLISFEKIDEPIKYVKNEPPLRSFFIKCQRKK